jgi:hypothetical protein
MPRSARGCTTPPVDLARAVVGGAASYCWGLHRTAASG